MDDSSDAEIVQRIAQGGAAAFEAEGVFCRRYALRVRLYGLKHLRDEDRARDLAQTVLLGVIEAARAGRIDDARRLDRFVLGTCRNTAARMREQAARTPLASEAALAALSGAPLEHIELTALFRCMGELEERARQVLQQSFLEERTAEEIASLQGLSPGNVRVVRHRALASLRRCLDAGERAP